MKKICMIPLWILFLLAAAAPICRAENEDTQSLVCTPAFVDFGTVVYGEKVPEPVTLTITNTGTKTVSIPSLQPYCENKNTIFMQNSVYPCVVKDLQPGESLSYTVDIADCPDAGTYRDTFRVSSASFTVSLCVEKADFKPPISIPPQKAVYGDWLHGVFLPAIDCGYFAWADCYNRSTKVGNVGTNEFLVTYYPPDLKNYNKVEKIPVRIVVSPAKPVFDVPQETAFCGQRLSDVTLLQGFAWCIKSPEVVKLQYGTTYYLASFFPDDPNYMTATVDIPVTVQHTRDESAKMTADADGHTYLCLCGKAVTQAHTFSEDNENVCTVCGFMPENGGTGTGEPSDNPGTTGEPSDNPGTGGSEEPKPMTGIAAFFEKIKAFILQIAELLKKLFG